MSRPEELDRDDPSYEGANSRAAVVRPGAMDTLRRDTLALIDALSDCASQHTQSCVVPRDVEAGSSRSLAEYSLSGFIQQILRGLHTHRSPILQRYVLVFACSASASASCSLSCLASRMRDSPGSNHTSRSFGRSLWIRPF